MRKTLPGKELNVVREKLKQKEEFANKISESLSAMEQENSELQDRYGRYRPLRVIHKVTVVKL
jgi:hypothetical protein